MCILGSYLVRYENQVYSMCAIGEIDVDVLCTIIPLLIFIWPTRCHTFKL